MKIYTAEIHAGEQTAKLLDEAWRIAQKLSENKKYINEPWFTREYQLTLAINGSAASARNRTLQDSWVDECLRDHINDMKKVLNG